MSPDKSLPHFAATLQTTFIFFSFKDGVTLLATLLLTYKSRGGIAVWRVRDSCKTPPFDSLPLGNVTLKFSSETA